VTIPPDTVAAIAQRLAEHAGLELPAWVIGARAAARLAVLGCSPAEYVQLIDTGRGAAELAELIEAVRVGESRLFRHRPQIDVLAQVIAPALRARGRRAIRVWSAGCAAGEEPYTLAAVLSRALPDAAISILATDVSADALADAAAAIYPRAALHDVPEPYRDRFIVDGDVIRVAPQLTALVRFERANLLDGATPRGCDLVWCRNVLIYFTADARKRAIDRLVGATLPGGVVFVGYSESLRDVAELEGVRASDAVYYVRRDREPARPASPPRPAAAIPAWVSDDRTPPPIVFAPEPPPHDTIALRGQPVAIRVTAELSARLGQPGLRSLTIDLDGADLLGDDLAPVLRRVCAAGRAAGVAVGLRATRPGARRWLTRNGLDEETS
jgi:chemotaxis protein methyltransferase CheR